MTLVNSTIASILYKFGNEICTNQVNLAVPFMGSGALKKVSQSEGGTWVTNIQSSIDSVRNIADGGTLPTGSSSDPTQASQGPIAVTGRLSIGRIAAATAVGGRQQIDIVKNQIEAVADEMGRQIGRAVFDSSYASHDGYTTSATWSGATPAAVTLKFPDITGFKEGAAVNYVDVSASKSYTVKVTLVTPLADGSLSANVAGEVTFENSVAGIAGTSGHANSDLAGIVVGTNDLWSQAGNYTGSGASNTATIGTHIMVSLTDICGSGTLHGLSGSVNGWAGNTAASFGALTAAGAAAFSQRIYQRSNAAPTHIVMSPVLAATYADVQMTTTSVRNVDGNLDKYGKDFSDGSGLALMGKPVITDPNCPNTKIFFHNTKHVDFRVWKELGPEGYSKDPQLIGNVNFDYDVQMSAIHQLTCRKRAAFGVVTGITGV